MKVAKLVSATERSITNLSFDERRVVIGSGVKFFLQAKSEADCLQSATVFLEVLVDGEQTAVFEFEDCIPLQMVVPANAAVLLKDIISKEELSELLEVIPTTILNTLAKEVELEIVVDDTTAPTSVTFTVTVGSQYVSRTVVDYEKAAPYVAVRPRR